MKRKLSPEGYAFLTDPTLLAALESVCRPIGVTPEEYLLRFEEVLESDPDALLSIFSSSLLRTPRVLP